jgi:excisionase family DNA binding protein
VSDLLKAKQAGARIGLSARTVYALAKAGKLACYRVGGKDSAVRFAPEDLDAYLTSCRSPVTTPAAGSTSLTARYPELDGSVLTNYFRKAGREPKPKRSTSAKQPAAMP